MSKEVIKVYDNGSVSRDKYTIITNLKTYKLGSSTISKALVLSENPHLQNGVSLWVDCIDNNKHGTEIPFHSLPDPVRLHAEFRIMLFKRTESKMRKRASLIGDLK